MRLLINDYGGYAFAAQLSRELAGRGHEVLHTFCLSHVSGKGALTVREGDPPSLTFGALDLGAPFAKHSIVKRFRQERLYGRLLTQAAQDFVPHAIVSGNTPLFAQDAISRWATRNRVPFTFWLQDLVSVAMNGELRRRFGRMSAPMRAYLTRLEARLLRHSAAIVSISEDFLPPLTAWHVLPDNVTVIENWAPLDEVAPRPRVNAWAVDHDLDRTFTFLYAGTLGLKHDPELLVRLALALRDEHGAQVVVVSEGVGAEHCRRRAAEEQLINLLVLPFQPYDAFPDMLASGDVLIAILEEEAGAFSVPSKVHSYIGAGRPILASVPDANLAARVITESGSGVVVAPRDHAGFVSAALSLRDEERLRRECSVNGRAYALKNFAISTKADAFESVLGVLQPDSADRRVSLA